jgi:hypothetical protein
MASYPSILDYQQNQRLKVPDLSGVQQMPQQAAPPLPPVNPSANPLLGAPAPTLPNVTQTPDPSIANTRTRLLGDQGELQRLGSTGSGISQIKSPLLRGLARFGDAAESILAPGAEAFTPGTEGNHTRLLGQESRLVNNDLANQQQQAQTALLDAQPQLKILGLQNAQLRNQAYSQHVADQGEHYDNQDANHLRDTGYTLDENDPTGQNIRPLRYEEMSVHQQATEDLKHAQAEQAEASAAMKKAQNDPTSPAFRLAKQRADAAQFNANTARGKLGIQSAQFEMRAHGTQNGIALPGSMVDDNGNTIGTAFQQNVRPTGTERNKGDMAASAADQINDMKAIIQRNPTMFGPGYGQTTEFKRWIGGQSPDAQRFVAARTIAGDHLAGTFGGRSEAALTALDNAAGQFKDNPEAAMAGLDQLAGANNRFLRAGTVKTTGNKAAGHSDGGKISVTAPDGSVHPFETQAQADTFKRLAGIK